MKKILFLIVLLFFALPTIAAKKETKEEPIKQNVEKTVFPECETLYEKANKTKNKDLMIKTFECAYNSSKDGSTEEQIKIVNENAIKAIIGLSSERYDITQDKKHLKRAYKYSKIAVDNGIQDVKVLNSAINLASIHLNTKYMIKAYDLLCITDEKYCKQNQEAFSNLMKSTKQKISERQTARLNAFAQGMQAAGTSMSDVSVQCYEYGNSVQCGKNYNRY